MKRKRSAVLLLILCMVACLLAGCGKDDDSEKEKNPSVVKGSISDMLEAMANVKEGTLHIDMDAESSWPSPSDGTKNLVKTVYGVDVSFDIPNGEYQVALKGALTRDGKTETVDLGDIITIADGKLYMNFSVIQKAAPELGLTDLDGWFMLPLPKDLSMDGLKQGTPALLADMCEKLLKGAKLTGEDGNYTVSLKNKEEYTAFINSLKAYAEGDLKSDLQKLSEATDSREMLKKIDWKEYLTDLLDEYESDIRTFVSKYGSDFGITENELDMYINQIKVADVNKLLEQYLEAGAKSGIAGYLGGADVDSAVEEIKREVTRTLENLERSDDLGDLYKYEVRVAADDTGYTVDFFEDGSSEQFETTETVNYKIRLEPKEISVSKQNNTVHLMDVFQLLESSYLRYVNKSKTATDTMTISDCMTAAEMIAYDAEFASPDATHYIMTFENGVFSLRVELPGGELDAEATEEWYHIVDTREMRSETGKKANGKFIGTIQSGTMLWYKEDADENLKELAGSIAKFER